MKYVLSVLAVILLIVIALVFVFNRGDDTATSEDDRTIALINYASTNSSVSHTTFGRLVGEEERRAVRIIVTPTERRLEILSGYDENVISGQTYQNTQTAYENFLSALNTAGFLRTKETTIQDERGICPTGNRYEYILRDSSEIKHNTWSSSCNSNGTFAGTASSVRRLFQEQIPEFQVLTRDVDL